MPFTEFVQSAVSQLFSYKLRSVLTIVGIVIGVITVILVVSLLEGFRGMIINNLNELGVNNFEVRRYGDYGEELDIPQKRKYRRPLRKAFADAIEEQCTSIELISAELWKLGETVVAQSRKTNPNLRVVGGTPALAISRRYVMESGRFITEQDLKSHHNIAVIGVDVADRLFPRGHALGKTLLVNGQRFRVGGVLKEQENSQLGENRNYIVILPLTSWEDTYGRHYSVRFNIVAKDAKHLNIAQEEVIGVLRSLRGIAPGRENDFYVSSNQELAASFNRIARKIQLGGIALGFISLIVGGIGVMNIMFVSVTERRREIGVRKAVGAGPQDILKQFLTEAVILCLLGGTLGFLIGIGLTTLISLLIKLPMPVPLWAVVTSLGITSSIGILAGIYPARRAARLSPIKALRDE